ncbi:MAG TPA: SurA N-terminal domain-containing protein [Rickettsia endosymbiont of Sericostoma sp.]|uniref:peptidylprolyl isomerase n=1 Tax=unclassified Candidatus Tisiphia TaxID=2996318 RepID=UPI001D2308BD|nr:SurA N-terminal domain-containing protein [Rickettsia endosymbiont of Sericostoma sp.]
MLNNIRNAADSFVMRILLGVIAFAFVGWGIKDVLHTSNNFDLITFSDANNISQEDFLKEKAEQIRAIQRQSGTNLSEEDIKQLNIDNFIIKKLINNRIINYLVSYYNLDLTDDNVIELIKENPNFKNEQGLFDIERFKGFLKNYYINEEDYFSDIKEHTLKNLLIRIFIESFPTPKIMVKNIVDYIAETRDVELVQIDLQRQSKDLVITPPTTSQLEDLYQNNLTLFEVPEKRNLSYVKISSEMLCQKIHNNDEELLNFYQDNKEEFANKKFSEVKKQVNELLQQQKAEQLKLLMIKNLEDDVASGSSLIEIAGKYELPIQNLESISYQGLAVNKIDIAQNADSIFDLAEGELSYPIELTEKGAFILVEIKSIQPSKVQEFSVVKEQVQKLWNEQYLKGLNLKTIETIAKEYTPTKNKEFLKVITSQSTAFSRSEIHNNHQLPAELLSAIFRTNIGSNTPVFQSKDKAYFAYIKSKKIDKKKNQEIQKKNEKDIASGIQNNIIDELISYAIKKNNMKQVGS